MSIIAVDFETFYSSTGPNKYSVRELGNWGYCHHERFDPYLISVSDGSEAWAGQPKDFDWESLRGHTLVSHNKGFDWAVYLRMVELGLAPAGLDADWLCTADMSAYLCNRRSLKDACGHLLKITMSKDVRDKADGKTWAQMVAEGWSGQMLEYGRGDSVKCQRLFAEFGHLWPEKERRLSRLNISQGYRGVGIDIPLLKKYISELQTSLFEIDKTLPWIADGRKPTSPKGVAEQCRREGIPCPPLKTEDEEGFDAWEAEYAPRFPWALQVSNRRSINKALANLQTVEERLRPDGTMGFSVKYFGAHTGRWSGDAGFNMQNLKRIPILLGDDYLPLTNESEIDAKIDVHEKTGVWESVRAIDARKILTPRNPDKNKFVMCDLSQIEPRVLNWLAGNTEFLSIVASGVPIYEAHARATMGWAGGVLKKEEPRKYSLAKMRVLQLGYQSGGAKFRTSAWKFGRLRLTQEEADTTVVDFRASNPKIVALWETLHSGIRDAVFRREDFELGLPSGRIMRYEKPFLSTKFEPDEDGKPVRRTQIMAGVGGRKLPFYGGKLAENITQATAREVFAEHMLDLDDAGIDTVFSVHDEAVTEVPHDFPASEIEHIMSRCPEWLPGCPIAAEAAEAAHYKK
jgi:hypothetical protein